MPRAYPDEFRARAVSLIRAGQSVRKTASDLDVSCAILHRWVKQEKIDRGELPGVPMPSPGSYAKHEDVFVSWKTRSRFFAGPMACWGVRPVTQKASRGSIDVLIGDGYRVKQCTRVLGVSSQVITNTVYDL